MVFLLDSSNHIVARSLLCVVLASHVLFFLKHFPRDYGALGTGRSGKLEFTDSLRRMRILCVYGGRSPVPIDDFLVVFDMTRLLEFRLQNLTIRL